MKHRFLLFSLSRSFAMRSAAFLLFFMEIAVPAKELSLLPLMKFSARREWAPEQAPALIADPIAGTPLNAIEGSTDSPCSLETAENGAITWKMIGEVGSMGRMFCTANMPEADYETMPYFRIRARSQGMARTIGKYNVLTIADRPVLEPGDFYNDGALHTVTGKFETLPKAGELLQLELKSEGSGMTLVIEEFLISDKLPADDAMFAKAGEDAWKGFEAVDISKEFNANFTEVAEKSAMRNRHAHDYPAFSADTVSVKGVPFQVKRDGKNLIMPPFHPEKLDKKGTLHDTSLGNNYFALSRLDEIVIPLSGRTRELYAILGGEIPAVRNEYAAPAIPVRIADVDSFGIQIDYADGSHDRTVPRHIVWNSFGVQGTAGAYAIMVDGTKELKAVRFQNRYRHHQIGVLALSRNAGAPPVIGENLRNPAPLKMNAGKSVTEKPLAVREADGKVTFINAHFEAVFSTNDGFALVSLQNFHAPDTPIALAPGGFEIKVGSRLLTGRHFRTGKVTMLPDGARFTLLSKVEDLPLEVNLSVTGDADDELRFRCEITNRGDEAIWAAARMPVLNNLAVGNLADTFVYFPKHRVSNRATNGSLFAPVHELAMHVQFMDFYNPKAGAGIAIHTRDQAAEIFDFLAVKNDSGIRAAISYPAEWSKIDPKSTRRLVDTALEFHGGDFHQALACYEKWLATWFKTYPTELPKAWHDLFYLRNECTNVDYGFRIPLYDEKADKLILDDLRKLAHEYMDTDTSLWHLAYWNNPKDSKPANNGNYDDGIYDPKNYYPSAQRLKDMIAQCHKRGELVSLYTIATYLPAGSPLAQKRGDLDVQIDSSGHMVKNDEAYFPCFAMWQETYAAAIKRAQAELGVDAIYIDCYPFGRYSTCWSHKHGHSVPMELNKSQREMLIKIRKALPKNVAIWSEYPSIDYDAAYMSGNITYYCTTVCDYRVKNVDANEAENRDFYEPLQNIQRYTMPHLKQVCFAVGWDPSGPRTNELNGTFFNGEGIYDVAFCLFDDHTRAKIQHWLKIQTALKDCFTSHKLFPMVPTAAGEIYANRFEGEGRRVWTLWNARFNTYRGKVLELPYKEGVNYFDAWNVRPALVERQGDNVIISISEMEPQGLGCILEYSGKLPEKLPETTVAKREKTLITYP